MPLWSVIGRSMDGVHFSTGPRPADEFEWMEECAVVVSDGWFAAAAEIDKCAEQRLAGAAFLVIGRSCQVTGRLE